MPNARLTAQAARKGCRIERLDKTRPEQPGWEIVPIEPHHSFAHLGNVHGIVCYALADVRAELALVEVSPCSADCECRD